MKTTLLAVLALVCFTFVASAADATGKWTAEVPGRNGNQTMTFNLTAAGSALTGSVTTARGDAPISDAHMLRVCAMMDQVVQQLQDTPVMTV